MDNHKKTKIIATIGPASDSIEKIAELIKAGVNIFRFNMKHATIEWHSERIKRVRRVAKKLNAIVAVLIDLQGPEIRLETKDKQEIKVQKGEQIIFSAKISDKAPVTVPQKEFFDCLDAGNFFLIDNGMLEFIVVKKRKNGLVAEALNAGLIKNRKGINVPGKKINLPSLVKDDFKKLDMAVKNKPDFVGLSFSRTKKDIETLKKELNKRKINSKIIAKMESRQALDNADEIIEAADAIMIARGDLGIEIPIEELAYSQKKIIKRCRRAKKPVIIATQMLQSMIENPRPTRAEATDVANAVYDGADAVMLSEETAVGKYPVQAVQAMSRILKFNEHKISNTKPNAEVKDLKQLIINAAVSIVDDKFKANVEYMVVFAASGYTARVLSSFHSKTNIIAITDRKDTAEALILSYGVIPIYAPKFIDINQSAEPVVEMLKKKGLAKSGRNLLFVHGEHRKNQGRISLIALVSVK